MADFSEYSDKVKLLLEVLPLINEHDCFALKGGTAINLFVRNMPRLSVDIDLTYLPLENRQSSLVNIASKLRIISQKILDMSNGAYQISELVNPQENMADSLRIYGNGTYIIMEVNPVVRGSVFECETRALCKAAQDQFFQAQNIKTLSIADLYGGKICAALGRHKPRDLFDVMFLLENEGITEEIRQALIIYVASVSRPMHELFCRTPNLDNLRRDFDSDLAGMTVDKISCSQLEDVMHILIKQVLADLTTNERKFLLSIKHGEPDWQLLPIPGIEKLPGIQWKLLNINKLKKANPSKYQEALGNLKKTLAL